jgi:hypothetical protein
VPEPCADPTEYFERFPQADILASSDDLAPSNPRGTDDLEELEAIHSAMNIGGRAGRCFVIAVCWWRAQSMLAGAG